MGPKFSLLFVMIVFLHPTFLITYTIVIPSSRTTSSCASCFTFCFSLAQHHASSLAQHHASSLRSSAKASATLPSSFLTNVGPKFSLFFVMIVLLHTPFLITYTIVIPSSQTPSSCASFLAICFPLAQHPTSSLAQHHASSLR
ncbi:hypothetical protein M407DRAFT_30634 [Tulasnella calospora MUT 4182]|uniref:Uncharacterized protein n=1 Tax=Tulasnella calospora MUT 4182 TaxID=1051891 RepID=A0A0C3Q709_9AGAM|nr:hypothetical protein M407DRAFT_30634 [Tulasnella calospora MUT 4182]